MSYTTKQQQAVLACLSQRREAPISAAELAEALRRSGHPVGLATIYRQLEKLEGSGLVHKVSTAEGALYQYCTHPHDHNCFLLRCEDCGRIVHLDCGHLEGLCSHLESAHHFRIDPRRTILKGRCEHCLQEVAHGVQ